MTRKQAAALAATHLDLMLELADVLRCDGLLQEDGVVQGIAEGGRLALVIPYGSGVFVLRAESGEDIPAARLPVVRGEESRKEVRRLLKRRQ